jgi:hypothetical protein
MSPERKLYHAARAIVALRAALETEEEAEWEVVAATTGDDETEGFCLQVTLRLVPPSEVGGIL